MKNKLVRFPCPNYSLPMNHDSWLMGHKDFEPMSVAHEGLKIKALSVIGVVKGLVSKRETLEKPKAT